jgi:8-oxo-dGTP diphosphatase
VEVVKQWSGRQAVALQAALRLTNEAFAERLGISVRTVASWHRDVEVTPRQELQAVLDTAFERATDSARERYSLLLASAVAPSAAQALRVAIAVIVRGGQTLLVHRRDGDSSGISWGFVAGVVKPGGRAESVVVREALSEAGVQIAVQRHLGGRLHPVTGVWCDYFQCSWLAGDVVNADPDENVAAMWVAHADVSRFIAPSMIYPPVAAVLEGAA